MTAPRPREQRRPLVRSARALAAAACLSLVGALALPTTALAQEAGTLVSNIGQGETTTRVFSLPYAQRFTTGPYEYGYTLSTVDVVSADAEGTSFSAKVCTVDGDGHPTSTCTDLAAPGTSGFAAGTITFYAPTNYVLGPGTTYTVVLTPPSQGIPEVTYGLTTANGEDAGKAAGWSIADRFDQESNPGTWVTSTSDRKFRIAIKGSEAPEPETTVNRPSEIRAYWNVPGHFGGNSMAGCAGTVPFRAFWERPKRADEWEAEVKPEYGASNLSLSSIEYIGDGFHELTGTVHIRDGEFGVVSIRVRGRFGDDGWGAWSRPTELFCVPPPPPRTLADGVKVTSSPASGDVYGPGETIEITVEFSSAVVVVGDPEFEFCMGNGECRTGTDPPARRRAAYSSGSGTTELVFSYVVGSDDDPDDDGNGIWIGDGTRTLQLDSDDRIRSAETDHNAEIEHNALGDQSDHKVDAEADIDGIAVTSSPASGDTYDTGETIEITVTFDLAVNVTGDPQFGISAGGEKLASLTRGSGTTELVFGYTVQFGDADDNGIWIGSHDHDSNPTFRLDSDDAITGAVTGHDADLAHDEIGQQNGHKVSGTTAPQGEAAHSEPQEDNEISALTASFEDEPGGHDGESAFTLRIAFSEAVAIDAPSVGVINGSVTEVRRVDGRDDLWEITVVPASNGVVFVSLLQPLNLACGEAGAICTADGRPLSVSISTAVRGPDEGPPPLTASLEDVPEAHDGESGFTFRIAFSEPLSWMNGRRLREDVVAVAGGRATSASRVDRRRDLWELTVEPDSPADVTVTLAAGAACGTPAAVCTSDGRALSNTISATVAGPAEEIAVEPLTASFTGLPETHDGGSAFRFRIAFSEDVAIAPRGLREDGLRVSGGRVADARRVDGRADLFEVRVRPDAGGDVTIVLPEGRACGAAGAVCTAGEPRRRLANTARATVRGLRALSVADARAREGEDPTLDFAVTLDRASSGTVTVDYATMDASAKAGEDYEARSGTLRFAPGETAKTVAVPVLDDAVDEGTEMLVLRLENARGAVLADRFAVGRIENSDPLQKMWLSRFGRTVAGQVVDAVTGRLSGPTGGSQVTLGGQRIDLSALSAGTGDAGRTLSGTPGAARDDDPLAGPGPLEAAQAGSWDDPETGGTARGMTGRELLLGSSFHLAAGGGEAGGPGFAAWGRMAVGGFDAEAPAEKGTVRLDGEVTTGLFGADAQGERWLAGLALSVSSAEGSFDQPGVDSGSVESTLTSVSPYVRYRASDRLTAWGLLGYGAGDMTMTQAANDTRGEIVTRTDLSMRLGAAGARGVLLEADESGGIDLALRGDAFLVQMESEKAANTVATKADASRLRLVLEAGRSFGLRSGAVLAPGLELGLRHDGGDAESGAGVEIGGRIRFADAGSGLTLEANARTLVAHEDAGYREWGAGGSLRLDPGASGRGLSLSLAPVWGTPSSGVERLWSARDAAGLAPGGEFEAERRLEAELGYGYGAFGGRGRVTPYAGLGLAEAGDRTWRAGARWSLAPTLAMSLDGTRREPANDDAPEHGVQFGFTLRW